MLKIAFIGEQCAGKTLASNLLKETMPNCQQIKFIDKMYQINDILGVPKNRAFMQGLGELIRKNFGEDFFVRDFIARFKDYKGDHVVVVDDVRTKLEFEAVKECGFFTIYIEADKHKRQKRAQNLGLQFIEDHPVELAIKDFKPLCDYVIVNNNSLDMFKNKLFLIFESISLKGKINE